MDLPNIALMKRTVTWNKSFKVLVVLLVPMLLNVAVSAWGSTVPIQHVIVIIQQNHTFDNYFGEYPGANGIPANASVPADPFDPQSASIEPFPMDPAKDVELHNGWPSAHEAYNKGSMNGFVYAQNIGEDSKFSMGFYAENDIAVYWRLAHEFVLFDNYFSSVMGDSLPNMLYLIAGQNGGITRGSQSTLKELASMNLTTIFDVLEAEDVSWKYYIGRYAQVINTTAEGGSSSASYWAPILSIPRFLSEPHLSAKIVDQEEFYADVFSGKLPQVSFILPSPTDHPGADFMRAQSRMTSFVDSVMSSNLWQSSVIFIVWDDWGGWYDHVSPPQVDPYGYGFRVPMILVSSYAKQGYISHVQHDHTSILKFILDLHGLPPLSERVGRANSMSDAFDFTQPARPPISPFLQPSSLPPTKPEVVQEVWVVYAVLLSFVIGVALILLLKKYRRRLSQSIKG